MLTMIAFKNAVVVLLCTSVLAANTVCACVGTLPEGAASPETADAPHAHHSHHDVQPEAHDATLTISCTQLDCEGCVPDARSADRDRVLEPGDEVALTAVATQRWQAHGQYAVLHTPNYKDPPYKRHTPTSRFDVLTQ